MTTRDRYDFEEGLLGSLHEMALRCCALAIFAPAAVTVAAFLAGHDFFSTGEDPVLSQPLLALALASFILVPMLALTGSVCGVLVATILLHAAGPLQLRAVRAAFLLAVGALSLAMALFYDLYLLPGLTG